jgi:hypothetical protein
VFLWTKAFLIVWDSDQGFFSNNLDLDQGFSNSFIRPKAFLIVEFGPKHVWSFWTSHFGLVILDWSFWTSHFGLVIFLDDHFCWSFLSVIFSHRKLQSYQNFGLIAVEILSTADCGYYYSYSSDYLIMDGDSNDSG